ncbi:MAG: DMT family transporter [Deltaproteobacteria bacterium]|nr:DMT family transporter [Deltaproteobacteria bacterium]
MTGEISALGCAFTWALSSVFTKSLAPRFHPLTLNLLRCLGASFVLWALIPFYPGIQSLYQAPAVSVLFLVISALLGICLGDTIYIEGLKMINVTLAFPLAQSSMPVLTLIAAVLFLGERMTWSLAVGAALVIGGIYLIAVPHGPAPAFPFSPTHQRKRRGIGLILMASVLWTISISLLKLGLQGVNLVMGNGIRLPLACLVFIPLALGQRQGDLFCKPKAREIFLGAFSGALSFGLGGFLFLVAIQYAGAGKAAVLTSCAPLFALPLSARYLKERVTARVLWGTGLGVMGIFFLL